MLRSFRSLSSRFLVLTTFSLALVAAGCGSKSSGSGRRDGGIPCIDESDCPAGQVCQGGFCTATGDGGVGDGGGTPGEIVVFPDPVQFGFAPLHVDTTLAVTIGNVGSGDLTVTNLRVIETDSATEYASSPSGPVNLVIPPNGNELVQVTLHPVDGELDFGQLEVTSDDPANPVVTVALESEYKGVPTLEVCTLDPAVPTPVPFTDCQVDAINGDAIIDYGVVTFGTPVTARVAIRNGADGNAPLEIMDATVQSPGDPTLEQEFTVRLFVFDTDGVTEIDVTPPIFLSAGDPLAGIDPELLYADVTFSANRDGIVTNTFLVVDTNDIQGRSVPISAAVSGCPPDFWDLNGDPADGCEYNCVYLGPEVCGSGADDNCDGNQDEPGASNCIQYWRDVDQDTYGVTGDWQCLCQADVANFYTANQGGDCVDSNDQVNPGASEICDGLDNDCANGVDDNLGSTTCGQGVCVNTVQNCVNGVPQTCDPMLGSGPEVCDNLDNDCNGLPDDNLGTTTCGLGVCNHTVQNCVNGVPNFCNPFDGASPEICDGLDNDCDGSPDADLAGEVDIDGDGSLSCDDCDDSDNQNFPGNTEICDGQDNDCNFIADAPGGEVDSDGDGSLSCEDCDDTDNQNFPGNPEVCDGQDNDCNGAADFPGGEGDIDGDGSFTCADCDDGDNQNFPGNTEICDGQDNNCNGLIDTAELPANQLCADVPQATEDCVAGACVVASCSANYYDINGVFGDGCECQAAPTPITAGNSCANAIDVGNLTDVSASLVTRIGNTPTAGRSVWYRFNAIDDIDTAGDEFHVDIRFTNNPGTVYRMDVYRGGCPGAGGEQNLALGESGQTDWFTNFNRRSTPCDGPPLLDCGEGNCTASPSFTANLCEDDGAPFFVRIYHVLGTPTCAQYSLEMSNGVY